MLKSNQCSMGTHTENKNKAPEEFILHTHEFSCPKGYLYMEDMTIKCIDQFLFFVGSEYEKYNSLVAESHFTLMYLTAKFDTRQEGQELISSNLLGFVAFS